MKYFGGFADRDDVKRQFSHYQQDIKNFPREDKILLAAYYDEDYEGDAFVLFERGGKLYAVYGSHCSCYGLEGQWEPEETTWEYMASQHFYVPRPVAYYDGAKQRLNDLVQQHTGVFVLRD